MNRIMLWVAMLAIGCALAVPARADFTLKSADGGYTVVFPSQPKKLPDDSDNGVVTRMYGLSVPAVAYLVGYSDYPSIPSVNDELDADVRNFDSSTKSTLVSSRRGTFRTENGRTLPEIEFTSRRGDGNVFRGVFVVSGTRLYSLIVGVAKGSNPEPVWQAYLGTFRIAR